MNNQPGTRNVLVRVGYLITIMVLMPLALWAISGGFFLNELLRGGMSYGLYRFLGFGGGQIIYILLFGLFWYGTGFSSLGSKKRKKPAAREDVGCAVFLVCITLLAVIILAASGIPNLADRLFPPRLSIASDVMDAAKQACKGLPVPDAAEYPGNTVLHPIVLANASGGWHALTNYLPQAWKPNSIHDIQLVACASESKNVTLQVCNYSMAGEFTRYQEVIDIRIVAARTGELVDEQQFVGVVPPECPDRISSSDISHSSIGTVNVSDALMKYVEP